MNENGLSERLTMKKVLMIAYHFHPGLEIGAVRSVKFAKYLPAFGWWPYVLTIDRKYLDVVDDTPLDFECDIYRTKKWPATRDINLWLKSLLKIKRSSRATVAFQSKPPKSADGGQHVLKVPLLRRIEYSLNWTPDDKIGWVVPAVIRAVKIIRRYDVEAIYSSGPPWTCHLVGLLLKKLTGKKWMADFRDPWKPFDKPPEITTALSRKIENGMANSVIKNADLVIATTEGYREQLAKDNREVVDGKFFVIRHGFDEEDFIFRRDRKKDTEGPVTILHAGLIFKGRDPSVFLRALGELLEEGFFRDDELRVEFVGNILTDIEKIRKVIADNNLDGIVRVEKPVKREEYLDKIANSDVLLLMHGSDQSIQIPGKTFEYIATGNEIIALMTEGEAYNLLKGFKNVQFAGGGDKEKIKMCVREAVARVRTARVGTRTGDSRLQDFTRTKLTEKLSGLLDEMVAG